VEGGSYSRARRRKNPDKTKEFDSLICGAGLRLIENVIKARIDWPDPLQGARQAFWPTLGGVPKLSAPSNWSHLHRTQAAKKIILKK